MLLHKLEDSFANLIQISRRKVCLAAEPSSGAGNVVLASIWKNRKRKLVPVATRPKSEHAMILAQIKDALTRAGIWALRIERISAARIYKKKG